MFLLQNILLKYHFVLSLLSFPLGLLAFQPLQHTYIIKLQQVNLLSLKLILFLNQFHQKVFPYLLMYQLQHLLSQLLPLIIHCQNRIQFGLVNQKQHLNQFVLVQVNIYTFYLSLLQSQIQHIVSSSKIFHDT